MPSSTTLSEPTRVLLVDDNSAMLSRAGAVLADSSLIVGVAQDGRAALAAAKSSHPDVIVLDISMPGMNGLEVASRLRATGSTAAIVFLTVHDEEDFILAASLAGGTGYVLKSRLVSDLPEAVREARAGHRFVSVRR
jgi:DNA-binding NarL/FixJ family response regulator